MYMLRFVQRFLTGNYEISTHVATTNATTVWKDPHGFRKVFVVATENGKVFGRDTKTGEALWTWNIALPHDIFKPKKVVVIKSAMEWADASSLFTTQHSLRYFPLPRKTQQQSQNGIISIASSNSTHHQHQQQLQRGT